MYQKAGKVAEIKVAHHLRQCGFKILEQNWRRRDVEVDIIARRGNELHFIEVKYRHASWQGEGYEYIGRAKLKKMHLGVVSYLNTQPALRGCEPCLMIASVYGPQFAVSMFELSS